MADEETISMPTWRFEIFGQYVYAFGHGAGDMHVHRRTIVALYDRYVGSIDETTWSKDAVHVLNWIRTIGRLAAQTSLTRGAIVIEEEDFTTAAKTVEAWVERHEPGFSPTAGKYCG